MVKGRYGIHLGAVGPLFYFIYLFVYFSSRHTHILSTSKFFLFIHRSYNIDRFRQSRPQTTATINVCRPAYAAWNISGEQHKQIILDSYQSGDMLYALQQF